MSDDIKIQVLPEVVQNKIAAGEVVERPASVVKELVENALDAGSNQIVIELEEGGHRLIRITDNGSGMSETDLMLSVERHATSKIRDVEDIFAIHTMGFRGEALPSIGSVSRMTLSTAVKGAEEGYRLVVEGGTRKRVEPCAPRQGTTIDVRDIFYNTPARKKFMKSAASEVAAVSEIVTRLSLAHPRVGFRLQNNGKTTIDLPVHNTAAERVAALFGRDVASRLSSICYERAEGVHLEGFCARPPESRSNSRGIYVFLNRRWIRHAGIVRVIRDAYQGALPPRRYPFAVLFLDVDPTLVDVNVHPTKEEVRFENDRLIVGGVRRAVEEALQNAVRQARTARTLPGTDHFLNEGVEKHDLPLAVGEEEGATTRPAMPGPARPEPLKMVSLPTGEETSPAGQDESPRAPTSPIQPQQQTLVSTPRHHVLAQAGNRYLVVESPDGILLVDQHALHERWNFERLKERKQSMVSQKLLLPIVVELAPEEAALFDEALPVLQEVGFEVERFGVATLSVSAVPDIVKTNKVEQVIRDVFADLQRGDGRRVFESIREHILARLACRSAVLFGKHLPQEALVSILDKFYEADQPLTCPHGRPTTITLTWEELERRFGRSG